MRLSFAGVLVVGGLLAIAVGCGSSDDPGSTGTSDITNTGSSGQTPPPPSTTTGGGGPTMQCAIGAAVESEPNDTPDTANAFTESSFCGVLGTGSDIDYSTFETPPGKKLVSFQAILHGQVDFELLVGPAVLSPSDTDKFVAGKYLVMAHTKSGAPASYQYRLDFAP